MEATHRRAAALSVWTVMGLLAVVVAWRGVSGAFTQPLPMSWCVLWMAAGHIAGGWAGRLFPVSDDSPRGAVVGCVGAILFGASLAAALTPFQWGVWIGAAMLHVAIVCEPLWFAGPEARGQRPEARGERQEARVEGAACISHLAPGLSPLAPDSDHWMTRRTDDDGEVCEGHVRVEFADGVRETAVHVAFCPSFSAIPDVELEDVDGLGWELKTTAVYPYGLRIAVRRGARDAAAASGRVAYWACAPGDTVRAA
jgi:hypothetical protein